MDRSNLRPPGRAIFIRLSIVLVGACICTNAAAQIKVAFLAPDPAGQSPFWDRTVAVMRAAADDLNVNLEVTHSRANTYSNRKDGQAVLNADEKPDFFITGYWSGATETLLELAERRGIRSFVINSGVTPADRNEVGRPREKYSGWLGQMTPRERQVGYELAGLLIDRSAAAGDTTIHVLGVGGRGNTETDIARQRGLEQRVDEAPDTVLDGFVFAQWSQTVAHRSLLEALKTNRDISAIWVSGDTMALGAVDAALENDLQPGEQVLIGGIGWAPAAIQSVADGQIEVLMGGHFLEGAWALILLHDYHHGHDFAEDLGVDFHTRLMPITSDNAAAYLEVLSKADWRDVDFGQFSKERNPDLTTYQWPLDGVFEQLQTATGGKGK